MNPSVSLFSHRVFVWGILNSWVADLDPDYAGLMDPDYAGLMDLDPDFADLMDPDTDFADLMDPDPDFSEKLERIKVLSSGCIQIILIGWIRIQIFLQG